MSSNVKTVKSAFTSKLLAWYDCNKRDLPWRRDPDFYKIWVSEVMAQQTRITTVIPYYERFMRAYPDMKKLSEASLDDVLALWAGLGYYRRARHLHQAAGIIFHEYDERVPDKKEELLRLPGIGDYTAGAILSMVYQQPEPAIDGNVLRVVARIENLCDPVGSKELREKVRKWILTVLPEECPGDFNQAIMEMGALVCLPSKPFCSKCPVHQSCKAKKTGEQDVLPVPKRKKTSREMHKTVFVIKNKNGEILMKKRTDSLLEGMWEYFVVDEKIRSVNEAKDYLDAVGIDAISIKELIKYKHVFSHQVWHMKGFEALLGRKRSFYDHVWVAKEDLGSMPLPAAYRIYNTNDS